MKSVTCFLTVIIIIGFIAFWGGCDKGGKLVKRTRYIAPLRAQLTAPDCRGRFALQGNVKCQNPNAKCSTPLLIHFRGIFDI